MHSGTALGDTFREGTFGMAELAETDTHPQESRYNPLNVEHGSSAEIAHDHWAA